MTDAKFYILGSIEAQSQLEFVCRLAQQLQAKGKQIHIHTASEEDANALDNLLWDFQPMAFVPHSLIAANDRPTSCSIDIGWGEQEPHHHEVMVNLCGALPRFFSRFDRLVEVVIQSDSVLKYTREHFRYLRERGYPVHHEDMRIRA